MKRREKEGWWNKECRELKEKVGEELRKSEGSKGGRKRLLGYEEKVQECVTRKKKKGKDRKEK